MMILMKASTINAAMADMTVIATRTVEFIIFMVLTATDSAGISSIRIISYVSSVARQ